MEMYRSLNDDSQVLQNYESMFPTAHVAVKEEPQSKILIKAHTTSACAKQAFEPTTPMPSPYSKLPAQSMEQATTPATTESLPSTNSASEQSSQLRKRTFDEFNTTSPPLWASPIPDAFNLDKSEFGVLGDCDLELLPVENQIDLSAIGDDSTSIATSQTSASMSTSMALSTMITSNGQMPSQQFPQQVPQQPCGSMFGTMVNCDLSPSSKRRRVPDQTACPVASSGTFVASESFASIPFATTQPTATTASGSEWRPLVDTATAATASNPMLNSLNAFVSASPPIRRRTPPAKKARSHTASPEPVLDDSDTTPVLPSPVRRLSDSSETSIVLTDTSSTAESDVAQDEVVKMDSETAEEALARANSVIRDLKCALEKANAKACALETQSRPPRSPQAEDVQLRVASKVEDVWYADRPFPAFNVELCDATTSQVLTRVHGWQLKVSLVDGYGRDAMDALGGQAASHGFKYTLTGGRATITGLRFTAVSSKRGGHFQLAVSVVSPEEAKLAVDTCYASRVQVLSYRLYHSPKVALDRLSPSDSLSKVRGIGSLYAKRFANMGIHTVGQLAEVDVQSMDDATQKSILEALRRDRGAMTLAKLENYVMQARSILGRHYSDSDESEMPVCI